MATKIKDIDDGGGAQTLSKHLSIDSIPIKASSPVKSRGTVATAGARVTCTVTRHFTDLNDNGMAWTRTIFCTAEGDKTWEVDIGQLPPGTYLLSFRAEREDTDCVEIVVGGTALLVARPISITNTRAFNNSITVTGTVLNAGAQVTC